MAPGESDGPGEAEEEPGPEEIEDEDASLALATLLAGVTAENIHVEIDISSRRWPGALVILLLTRVFILSRRRGSERMPLHVDECATNIL